jgi:hypothetical protein
VSHPDRGLPHQRHPEPYSSIPGSGDPASASLTRSLNVREQRRLHHESFS